MQHFFRVENVCALIIPLLCRISQVTGPFVGVIFGIMVVAQGFGSHEHYEGKVRLAQASTLLGDAKARYTPTTIIQTTMGPDCAFFTTSSVRPR